VKLEKVGIIAEIVGTTAIVVTLALVLYELRQNTAASYASSWDAITEAQIGWRMAMAENSDMREAWAEKIGADLDVGNLIGTALLLNYERAYFANFYGRLGDDEWARYQRSMCGPSFQKFLAEVNPGFFTDVFWAELQRCAQ
jgi:hypothetical protein